ncbi:MAG: hypothetical protein HOP19_18135 [Acidobacteria bacterium]|nr:hypothetical protein [Acidobacteriota bacterium]
MSTENTPTTTAAEADGILENLINETQSGKLRWGFQPPATAQANRGAAHLVLRRRRTVFRLTTRHDGGKEIDLMIERREPEGGLMTTLFGLATGETAR